MIRLCDISAAQPVVDFDKVKASGLVVGCIVKATQANGYRDPAFSKHFQDAGRVGLLRGAYHFADPDESSGDAVTEANNFIATVRAAGGLSNEFEPLFLVLDIEAAAKIHSGLNFTNWVLAWCEQVETVTGIRPWIYTGGPFWREHSGAHDAATTARLQRYPLWLAAYTNSPKPFLPPDWDHQELWQDTGDFAPKGKSLLHVPGVGGPTTNVDSDVYYGTLDDLTALLLSLRAVGKTYGPSFPDTPATPLGWEIDSCN